MKAKDEGVSFWRVSVVATLVLTFLIWWIASSDASRNVDANQSVNNTVVSVLLMDQQSAWVAVYPEEPFVGETGQERRRAVHALVHGTVANIGPDEYHLIGSILLGALDDADLPAASVTVTYVTHVLAVPNSELTLG